MRPSLPSSFAKIILIFCLTILAMSSAFAQVNGAIQTTTSDGTVVNANIYPSKDAVYLTGGPQNEHDSGLSPDGLYYFQVTDPSGATLLSTDDISCREVQVTGGKIVDIAGSCPHAKGTLDIANGEQPVQLVPYNDTPNPGGEYKAWLTPVADYQNCVSGTDPTVQPFCFVSSNTKTDNFKVKATVGFVSICKFNDLDASGSQDAGEPLIAHWPITAVGVDDGNTTNATVNTQTGDNGCVKFAVTSFPGGSQDVTLTEGTFGPDWTETAPLNGTCTLVGNPTDACSISGVTPNVTSSHGGTIVLTLIPGDDVIAPYFGNNNPFCSDECAGGGLIVTKTATPSFTRMFTWGITKSVDNPTVYSAGGSTSGAANYTVSVTHDAGADSGWQVTGSIRVSNPSGSDVTGVTVADAVDNSGTCVINDINQGQNESIPSGSHVDFPYTCTYTSAPSPAAGTNTATANGFPGTATFDFSKATPTVIDGSVTVTDTLGGTLGTVSSTDSSPTTFTYSKTFTDPAGTCTSHKNTATFTTNTTSTTGSDSQTVKDCQGADLTVSKTATPSFTRTYNWSINKTVDQTKVETSATSVKFNYTVAVSETGFTDSGWQVTGTITVTNPNDWETVTVNVGDVINNGGSCIVTGGTNQSVAASSSISPTYTCTYVAAPSPAAFTNTATATWDKTATSTPDGSASGTATGSFASVSPKLVNQTITPQDNFNGGGNVNLCTLDTTGPCTLTAVNTTPYTTHTYKYSRTVNNAGGGACVSYTNIAIIKETGDKSSQTVTVCNTATGALTMGFWQNKNGQAIITGGASNGNVCNSGTSLRQLAPFQDLSATATCAQVATYVTNIIKAANASGAAMNAMLKAQMLSTALDVYFSTPGLGGNKIGAAQPLGGVKIDLTKVCIMIDNTGGTGSCSGKTEDCSSAFGGTPNCQTVSALLTFAASQSNAGGSIWYAQNKTTQGLAKNTFDAINNQAAFICP